MDNPKSPCIRIIPLGGFDRIGLNMTIIESDDAIVVIDCGRSFAEDGMPGVAASVPDMDYLFKNRDRVKAILLTHAHADHIGALPYCLQNLPVPVLGTPYTIGFARTTLKDMPEAQKLLKAVDFEKTIRLGSMHAEFIRVNHSIPDAAAIAVFTPAGIILHSGDFKIDYTPLFEQPMNLRRIAMLGYRGVLALITDSTNALVPGVSPSEERVINAIRRVFREYTSGRIWISTFTTNIHRIHGIIRTAYEQGRRCVLLGSGMEAAAGIAKDLGYFDVPENSLLPVSALGEVPPEQTVIILEDRQRKGRSILQQIIEGGIQESVRIEKGDTIIFSSTPLPGMELEFSQGISLLEKLGARVVYQDVHASGHACVEELKQLYTLIGPRYVIPAHGDYRYRFANAQTAMSTGVSSDRVFLLENGDILSLSEDGGKIIGDIKTDPLLVDGTTVGDTGHMVLQERGQLGENGIVVVQAIFGRGGSLISGPDLFTKGLVYEPEARNLLRGMKDVVLHSLYVSAQNRYLDYGKLRSRIRSDLEAYLWEQLEKKPVILCLLTEVR